MSKRIPNDPVTIYRPRTLAEAKVATVALEGAGIATFTLNGETGSNLWHVGLPVAISVQVARRHEAAAKSLIAELEGRTDDANRPMTSCQTGNCADCEADWEPGFDICWSCGAQIGPR